MKQNHTIRQRASTLSGLCLVLIGALAPAYAQGAEGTFSQPRLGVTPLSRATEAVDADSSQTDTPDGSAVPGKNAASKKLPALKRSTSQHTQLNTGNKADDLNPQPLPPKKTDTGNRAKSILGSGIHDKAGLKTDATQLPQNLLNINGGMPIGNAVPGQNQPLKNLPAFQRPALQPAQTGLGGKAMGLNPLPLPPKLSGPGDSAKSILGSDIQQQRALTPPAAGLNDKAGVKANAVKSPKNLFSLEDRAIIIVGGKQTTAGAAKKALYAEIAAKAGPPKTVKGGARKLDLAALNVTNSAVSGQPAPQKTMEGPGVMGNKPGGIKPLIVSQSVAASRLSSQVAQGAPSTAFKNKVANISVLKCPGNGPPTISEVEGRLKPGGKVTLWGSCFGDRAGRVEIIGQFPGGKLKPAFTAWDMNGVELEIPANIRGAMDHTVAVSIVTADGKTSAAMPAQFIAARERVEVPERLWSPSARFELAATGGPQPDQPTCLEDPCPLIRRIPARLQNRCG